MSGQDVQFGKMAYIVLYYMAPSRHQATYKDMFKS